MNLQRQRGITLVMALIMLVVLTMLALASFNLGKSNLQVVGNMQQRDESVTAARGLLEEVVSDKRFAESPTAAVSNPCEKPNQRCVDVNGDGTTDIKVAIATPTCVKVQAIKNTELNLEVKKEADCLIEPPSGGPEGSNTGDSLCANSVWEVQATATDQLTKATVQVTQGIAIRVAKDDTDTNCKI